MFRRSSFMQWGVVAGVLNLLAGACAIAQNESPQKSVTQESKTPTSGPEIRVDQRSDVPTPTVKLKPGEVPKPKFDALVFEFPRTPAGKDAVHDFTFTNTGNGPLEILVVRPSCGCTTTGNYDRVIPPGGKGKIPVKVATTNFSGHINKTLAVVTNAPEPDTNIGLSMRGDVWEPFTLIPKTIGFGRVSVQDPASATTVTVKIINNSTTPANLTNLRCNHPNFKGELKVITAGKEFELRASLTQPFQGGVASGNFEIDTAVPEMPKLDLPASAWLSGDLEVYPNRLQLPAKRSNDLQRQFSIVNNSSKPIQIGEVKCTSPDLKASVEEVRPGMAFKVVVDIPKTYMIHPGGDVISVKTNSSTSPLVSIAITEAKLTGPSVGVPIGVGETPLRDPAEEALKPGRKN